MILDIIFVKCLDNTIPAKIFPPLVKLDYFK
jgi:hypothetical protein